MSNLIAAGMIPDPRLSPYSQVRFFVKYLEIILSTLILTPIIGFIIAWTYNRLTIHSAKKPSGDLIEPLLPTKAEGTSSTDQICLEQVVTSSNSIKITFSDKIGSRGDLTVKEGLKAIVVKAAYTN